VLARERPAVSRSRSAVRARVSPDRYHALATEICRRYVDAYDPTTPVADYVSVEPGVIVEIVADVMHAWDYADDQLMP
jgi:hypothetical protein